MSQPAFSTLELQADLQKNLLSLGYQSMTSIQALSLPPILAGRDVIAQGKTGSGKTAAFGIGLLEKLNRKRFCVQSLVLCPTRELADQVAKEIRRLARATDNVKVLTLCGGTPFGPQLGSLQHGAHIVVGTPGRVEEHLRKRSLVLDNVTTLVLDEADRMLDMGFKPTLDAIVALVPRQRQTLLFSATYPDQIQHMAESMMREPVLAQITELHDENTIAQHFYRVGEEAERMTALRLLLLHHGLESTVVFCNTRREVQQVAEQLLRFGFSALALHGDLEQRDRDQMLVRFANKSASVLVATDVAARGLDIDALDAVINYHIARDVEVHVHRVGRTGRAGGTGMAFSLFNQKEHYKVALLQDYLGQIIEAEALPPMRTLDKPAVAAPMVTLQIDGGKKRKLRPGDIVGALTGENGIAAAQIGKIAIFDYCAYIAVERRVLQAALRKLGQGKLKGRSFRVRSIER